MPRLLIHVEGQTEETFVKEVLAEHLMPFGYESVSARLVGNPRMKRGGIRPWPGVKRDLIRHLKQDQSAVAAIMADYYGLPHGWPGRAEAPERNSSSGKAEHVEASLQANINEEMGDRFDPRRFVPLIMMHEFEALLFSDPDRFAQAIGKPGLTQRFREVRQDFPCPEDINDSPMTAPSKRIENLFAGYEKPLFGVVAVLEIGLQTMRRECPHFDKWMERLELIPQECAYLG